MSCLHLYKKDVSIGKVVNEGLQKNKANDDVALSARKFVFLQGPHGPFFRKTAALLKQAGPQVERIGFNRADEVFWSRHLPYTPYRGTLDEWKAYFADYVRANQVTDIVLYGDMRQIHADAREVAKDLGLEIHVLEEGYLRPYWVTYERDGVNGNSELMAMNMADIRKKRASRVVDLQAAPSQWGALWHHVFFGFLYHMFLIFPSSKYQNYKPHRGISVWKEWYFNTLRLMGLPWHALQRRIGTWQFLRTGRPYSVVLLQLEHDASLQFHSNYKSQKEFIEDVVAGFAEGAPRHHVLAFKAHPLDDHRVPLHRWAKDAAKRHGVEDRIEFFYGGKLSTLLEPARSVVTINSTAAQQALWRAIPVRMLGHSIFDNKGFTSKQDLPAFFAAPVHPVKEDYLEFRTFLLETSQIPGGFYTTNGRASVLRNVVDMMLADCHPYQMESRQ